MTESTLRKSDDDDERPDSNAMPALETLPVFFRAAGRRIVVAGGSDAVAWKVELCSAASAHVDVYAADPGERLLRIAAADAGIVVHARRWEPADLDGALMAVVDAGSQDEAAAFSAAARRAGVPVNVIDRPDFCDFQFGSIVNRSPLVISISTGGAAPVFGQALRGRIETLIPAGFAAWARAARQWRGEIAGRNLPFRARRKFWEMFAARALAHPGRAPDEADLRDLVGAALSREGLEAAAKGRVLLVGAGPGDPELLTLRAVRALQSADVVLYDDLAAPAVLDMARREAERINVGKRGDRASPRQTEISALLVELATAGKTVVRLKGGDPMIFGRADEEIAALKAAGLQFEVVPGVTAASGAAAAIGVSLTSKDRAGRVQFVTGHGSDGRLPPDLNWTALADPRATTVVYMGKKNIAEFTKRLMEAGLPEGTSATMVENASTQDQRIVASTIGSIAPLMTLGTPSGPCVLLIGPRP